MFSRVMPVELLGQVARARQEHVVVALDLGLLVDVAAGPAAVRAAHVELPAHVLDLAPVERMHPVGPALRAELDPANADPLADASACGRGGLLLPPCLEVDQLHHLAAGELDPLDVKLCHFCLVL